MEDFLASCSLKIHCHNLQRLRHDWSFQKSPFLRSTRWQNSHDALLDMNFSITRGLSSKRLSWFLQEQTKSNHYRCVSMVNQRGCLYRGEAEKEATFYEVRGPIHPSVSCSPQLETKILPMSSVKGSKLGIMCHARLISHFSFITDALF